MILANGCNITKSEKLKGVWIYHIYVHIILRFWPLCLQFYYRMFTHGWLCAMCSFCDSWGSYIVCLCFLNENMVKSVQNGVFVEFCRRHWENWSVCENRWNVLSFKKHVSRTVWMVCKIVKLISYSVLAIEKNCKFKLVKTIILNL